MDGNRTGLSPADIAESFRDRCGDGSVEWVYTPTQTWVLLDAADMLDENAKLLMRLNAEHLVRQNVERENAKLRELVARLIRHIENPPCESCMAEMSCAGGEGLTNCDEYQFMVCDARELGVDA